MKSVKIVNKTEHEIRTGDFKTPEIWAIEAIKMIEDVFGSDCREKYIFWDNCCGECNLTRYWEFKELYASTLQQSDIDTANQMGYNKDSVKFQYDFLNDGIVDGKIDVAGDFKLPLGLRDAILSGKEIIVFINPPYGTANEAGAKGDNKSGISLTKTNQLLQRRF